MDVSPSQSGSKCSSDFSIERILSDERRIDEVSPEVPNWLCCTRYQPPRIPRASNGSVCRGRRSGRHARVPFTASQAAALEAAYSRAPYLAPPALRALAAALQLRDDRIKIWFQNRRARARREKCNVVSPSQAVALPATALPHTHIASTVTWTNSINIPCNFNENMYQTEAPQDLSVLRNVTTRPLMEISIEDRPESPLDVESIEEN